MTVRQIRERVALPLARYEAEKGRIFAAISDHGQVLLVLDQSYPFRVGLLGSSKLANQLLINVDKRDEFLTDFELKVNSVEKRAFDVEESGFSNGKDNANILSTLQTTHASKQPTSTTLDSYSKLAIRTEHLTRLYKEFVAVEDLNLAVRAGEIYGFLGSNGAGKTTTMKMLVGLLKPDAGHVWIAGHDVLKESITAKSAFGYVADHTMLYDRLTGREFLEFLTQIQGLAEQEANRRIEQLLGILELRDRVDTACGTFSFGMKRKLAIAGALIHEPKVLILDEPLNGLDPLSARRLKDLFTERAANGTTIFLSTHDLATAESICHRVGIIHKGHLLVEGSSSELRQIAGAPGLEEAFLSLTAVEMGVSV